MTTSIRLRREPNGRLRADLRAGELSPRVLDRGADHVRVALVAVVALLLAGDDVAVEIDVGPGLHLEIVETSGIVAYDMRGGAASWRVDVHLAEGATLVWAGLPFVVSSGAAVTRRTVVTMAQDARALFRETFVLGRSGEVGGDLLVGTDVRRPDGRPVLREDLDLTREHRQGAALLGDSRCLDQVTLLGVRSDLTGPDVLQLAEPGTLVRALTGELHQSPLDDRGTYDRMLRDVTRPMPGSIRSAVPTDAAALHRLAALTFPLACTPDTPEEEKQAFIAEQLSESVFVRYLGDPARILLVAVEDASAALIGYSMLSTEAPADADVADAIRHRPTVELSKMYVHPGHHGDGTAGRLLMRTLAAARDTGAAGIWLGVSEENTRANTFYAKHGFEQVGRKRFHIGDRSEDDFVRELAL